ncbi:hypothetical protein R6Q57_007598 [Mikania cordata]
MDSNFYNDQTLSYAPNLHAISFQLSATDIITEMIMMRDCHRTNTRDKKLFCEEKLQDNVKLFNHATNNITAILKDMRYIPGSPLPVSLNTNLVNTIQPTTSQVTDNSLSTT